MRFFITLQKEQRWCAEPDEHAFGSVGGERRNCVAVYLSRGLRKLCGCVGDMLYLMQGWAGDSHRANCATEQYNVSERSAQELSSRSRSGEPPFREPLASAIGSMVGRFAKSIRLYLPAPDLRKRWEVPVVSHCSASQQLPGVLSRRRGRWRGISVRAQGRQKLRLGD